MSLGLFILILAALYILTAVLICAVVIGLCRLITSLSGDDEPESFSSPIKPKE